MLKPLKPWLPLLRKPQVYSAVYDLCDLRDNQGLIDIARAEKLANVISADLEAANSKNRLVRYVITTIDDRKAGRIIFFAEVNK
jgi:hypothetical protein